HGSSASRRGRTRPDVGRRGLHWRRPRRSIGGSCSSRLLGSSGSSCRFTCTIQATLPGLHRPADRDDVAHCVHGSSDHETPEEVLMPDFALKEREPQLAAAIHAEVPAAEIRSVYDRGFPELMRVVQSSGAQMLGAPFGYYPRMPSDTIEVLIGIPIDREIVAEGDVEPFTLPGGTAVVGTHVGPYDGL